MKKIIFGLAVAISCTTVSYKSFAQKYFAGTITFETKYEGDTDPQRHIPSQQTCIIFENKEKAELYNGVLRTIKDGDALTVTMLVDWPGYPRIGYVSDKEATQKALSSQKFSYEERSDTKTICGYECKGYNVTAVVKEEEEEDEEEEAVELKYIVYTTKEIGKDDNINALDYPGLSGYPLYVESEKDGVKTIIQASEVKKSKLKAVDFMVPSDYKMCSEEEFQEEMIKRAQGQ
ncbi:MAG: hypothetical protein FWH36_01120 [Lentimicrobiaceae bacterium]|nr:hypothetical protein [Lentimicrobiaceae bacterium]